MFVSRTRLFLGLCTLALLAAPDAAHAGTMPQLDFANPLLTSQVVWGAIIFVVFYLALSRMALPKVGAVLERRAQSIAGDLNTALAAKAAADTARDAVTAARHQAAAEGQAAITAATDRAKAAAAAQAATLNAALDAQLAQAEQQIAAARGAAMGALGEVAAETAGALITRLTGKRASPDHLAGAVGTVMAARGINAA